MVDWMDLTDSGTLEAIKVKPITVVFMSVTKWGSTELTIICADRTKVIRVCEPIDEVQERMYHKPFWRWRR